MQDYISVTELCFFPSLQLLKNMLIERDKIRHEESNLFFVMDCHIADVSFHQKSLHKSILN